jgi:hypothetical protein
MAQIFDPILDKYFRYVNQATWQNAGEDFETSLGDIEASGATPTFQDIERPSREYPWKTIAAIHTIGGDLNLTLTAMSLTKTAKQAVWMDNSDALVNQAAATGLTKTFTNLADGRIYNLGKENTEINSADDGAAEDPIAFIEGTHYRHHSETGRVQLIKAPVGATQFVVDFDAGAITNADEIAEYGGMSSFGKEGTLRYYGVSDIGQNFLIEFYRCRLRAAGEIALQGADDYGQVALEARVLADGTKPVRFRYFRVRELKG